MDGVLNICKSSGTTSFAVVAQIKRLLSEPKVGHGGTLDPLASGVLPVLLGQATRLAEYLMEYPKTYHAFVELGVSTDTYDAEGMVTGTSDISDITAENVSETMKRFRGEILQTPPIYSAIKHQGQPLYKIARQGKKVEIDSRLISIYRLELVAFEPPYLTFDVDCSKGTYIRSIAHDLGVMLGCGAYLKGLIRTAYGPLDIKDAVTFEALERIVTAGTWHDVIQPMGTVLSLWRKIILSDEQEELVRHGMGLLLEAGYEAAGRLRAYDTKDHIIALLQFDIESGVWRPQKVFHQPGVLQEKRPNP
jgi:tRNA pseudouridine55 synthase